MKSYTLPPRPSLLPISKTYIYKTIEYSSLATDIYLPEERKKDGLRHPIMLFIHGGGWMGGTRTDYCRPLFQHFLQAGFIVAAMDYRLLPETSFEGQLADIKDVQPWLRTQLPLHLRPEGFELDVETIAIVGGSAGAHLALMTPKLWSPLPTAILSLYGPTNMHALPYLNKGRLHQLTIPTPCTHELLLRATDYLHPPTETSLPRTAADDLRSRSVMATHVFRQGIIAELLLRGLGGESGFGKLTLPERGCVASSEIDEISPLALCRVHRYPPIYQVMGTGDEVFETTHATDFNAALEQTGVECKTVLVPSLGHAFDIWAEAGDETDEKVIGPAVEWIVEVTKRTT